jgi:protein tyrosine phosphatase type 4A
LHCIALQYITCTTHTVIKLKKIAKKNPKMRSETALLNAHNSNVMAASKPSFIKSSPLQFLIMDAPRSNNLHHYIKECKKHNVTDIVRVCEPTYSKTNLQKAGITLHEMPYPDGHSPPDDVLDRWLKLVDETFLHPNSNPMSSTKGSTTTASTTNSPTIAVHCVAGLGRAPVLVAIALIEFSKMEPVDAATFIRSHRKGAINITQLEWLERYKRRYKSRAGAGGCCVVM